MPDVCVSRNGKLTQRALLFEGLGATRLRTLVWLLTSVGSTMLVKCLLCRKSLAALFTGERFVFT